MPRAIHTRTSVCEPLGNNDGRAAGSKATRLLRSAFMDCCNPPSTSVGFLGQTLPLWLLDSSPRSEDESRGGYCTAPNAQVHIGPWTMNQWYGPKIQPSHQQEPRPKPTNCYKCELSVVRTLRRRIAYTLLTVCSGNHFRALCICSVALPRHIAIKMPGRTLGNSTAEHINGSGNHFQSHSYLKIHLSLLTLDPSLH